MKFHALSFSLVFFLLWSAQASGDEEALPRDYSQVTENGQYVFVMLPTKQGWFDFVDEDKKLRDKYPQSGLYRNDGSTTPLWAVDWHAGEVYPSSDGKHLVEMGPWARVWDEKDLEPGGPALKQLAVAFHENGKLLKEYTIGEVVDDAKKLPKTVSHFGWKKDVELDEGLGRFTVTTLEGKRFVFDITSGEIVERG